MKFLNDAIPIHNNLSSTHRGSRFNNLSDMLPGSQGDSEGSGELGGDGGHPGHSLQHQRGGHDGGWGSVVQVSQVSYRVL